MLTPNSGSSIGSSGTDSEREAEATAAAPLMYFAALYDTYADRDGRLVEAGETLHSFSVLTTYTPPRSAFAQIHHRSPIVLWSAAAARAWLDPALSFAAAKRAVLDPAAAPDTQCDVAALCEWHEVSQAVNNWRNDAPANVAPLRKRTILNFFSKSPKKKVAPKEKREEEEEEKKKESKKKNKEEEEEEEEAAAAHSCNVKRRKMETINVDL